MTVETILEQRWQAATIRDNFIFGKTFETNPDLCKRMRYYQGLIDLDKLKRGQHYSELGKVFIIFICPFQCFDGERHIYTFNNLCVENPAVALEDGATKIFLSTKGTINDVSVEVKN